MAFNARRMWCRATYATPSACGSSVIQTVGCSVLPPPPLPISLAKVHALVSTSSRADRSIASILATDRAAPDLRRAVARRPLSIAHTAAWPRGLMRRFLAGQLGLADRQTAQGHEIAPRLEGEHAHLPGDFASDEGQRFG